MRILLTGAAGFLGAHTARALLNAGHEVIGLVRAESERSRLDALAPGLVTCTADLMNEFDLRRAVETTLPEAAIHLAWFAVPGAYLSSPENLRHLAASHVLLGALASSGCRRFVTAGTCFEYDTELGWLSERTPLAPKYLYSASKVALFHTVREAARLAGISHAHLRFFYQFGPHEAQTRLVPSVIGALLGGGVADTTEGAQVRDFLHVADVSSAVATVVASDVEGAVNVGSGRPVTVRELVATVGAACGALERVRFGALPYRAGDPMFVCADNRLLASLGWIPRFTLEEGVADTVRWFRERARS